MTSGSSLVATTADSFELARGLGGGDPSTPRHDDLAEGMARLGFGSPDSVCKDSLVAHSRDSAPMRIVIVGRHDRTRLASTPIPRIALTPGPDLAIGAGVASQFGPFLAAVQGAHLASAGNRVMVTAVSLGTADDIIDVTEAAHIGEPDLIICTESVAWDPERPTITTGCRGRLEAEITVTAPAGYNDHVFGGISLNPLQRLVELLARLRNDRGRIALPGFYDRAQPPDRDSLLGVGRDEWFELVGGARPAGRLSAVQRATQWPVMNIADLSTNSLVGTTPHSASAVVTFSLVPDQRPVDVERALRAFVSEQMPDTLTGAVRILGSFRPWTIDSDEPARNDLATALSQVHGSPALAVAAGGTAGSGELHFRYNAPVLNMGIAGPDQRWGSVDESLPRHLFDAGVAVTEGVVTGAMKRHRS